MRTFARFAVVAALAASVAFTGSPAVSATTAKTVALPASCKAVQQLPAYKTKYQGATIYVPKGTSLVKEVTQNVKSQSKRNGNCIGLLRQYTSDMRKAGF